MIQNEIYSIDINEKGSLLIYGGNSDIVYVSQFPTLKIIHRLDDFEESIIYTKFITNDHFISATIDGVVSLHFIQDREIHEIKRIDLDDDITKISFIENYIAIGTGRGNIQIFKRNLDDDIFLEGHKSEITDFMKVENKFYSLSKEELIVFDFCTEEILFRYKLNGYISVCYSSVYDKIFLASENKSIIMKNSEITTSFEFGAESVIFADHFFISGGDNSSLNIFDVRSFNNQCRRYDFSYQYLDIHGISKIIYLNKQIIGLSTFCGKIIAGHYEMPKSLKVFEGGVGTIFDFRFYHRHIIICGSEGINVIDL